MLGYLFLAVALLGGGAKVYASKYTSTTIKESNEVLIINFLRVLLCAVIGFILAFIESGNMGIFKCNGLFLVLSMLSGVFLSIFMVLWLYSVKSGAYVMVDAFVTAGTLIPLIGSSVLLDEKILPIQWVGFFIVVAGVIILCSYNNSLKKKLSLKSFIVLIIVGASNGIVDLLQKIFVGFCNEGNNSVFNLYTYLFSAATLLIVLLIRKVDSGNIKTKTKSVWIYILIMAIGQFLNSYFKVEAAKLIDAAKLYPLSQGAALAMGTMIASVFFGEKVNAKCIFGLIAGFVGICIMNMF